MQGLWGNMREGDHLLVPGVDRRVILKWIIEKLDWGKGLDHLAQDRDRWWAVVNVVMNLRIA
jgi:hypothetical protein